MTLARARRSFLGISLFRNAALLALALWTSVPSALATPSFDPSTPWHSTPWNAVPTFESIGLYWKPSGGGASQTANVRFRPKNTTNWREGHALWWDSRNSEYRGSLVELQHNTVYEIQLRLGGGGAWSDTTTSCDGASASNCKLTMTDVCTLSTEKQCTRTWDANFSVTHTVLVPAGITHIDINPVTGTNASGSQSGTTFTVSAPTGSSGYTRVAPGSSDKTITGDANAACVVIKPGSQRVIVSGFVLENCKQWGVHFDIDNATVRTTDIVIDDNEVRGWGRPGVVDGRNVDDGAIHCNETDPNPAASVKPERIVVQRNKIHNPRHSANYWGWVPNVPNSGTHPHGPQGVFFGRCGGNHVFRYNDIYSTNGNHYNDAIGGCCNFDSESNFDDNQGFPGYDSDIHANRISHVYDDGIESEGPNRNVRIWANYVDLVFQPFANVVNREGPLYFWRNVSNKTASMGNPNLDSDHDSRGAWIKAGNKGNANWSGRAYYYHNTVLQPPAPSGMQRTLGPVGLQQIDGPFFNFVSKNNILQTYRNGGGSIIASCSGQFCEANHDLFNGALSGISGEADGWGSPAGGDWLGSRPRYADPDPSDSSYPAPSALPSDGNNWSGDFRLLAGTKGTQTDSIGSVGLIPNFNDLEGTRHVGAQPAGQDRMRFGRCAAGGTGCGTTPPTAVLNTSPTPATGPAPFNVTFSSASTQGSAAFTSITLDFGDGSPVADWTTDHSSPKTHQYAAGNRTARLTVITAHGSDTADVPVNATANTCSQPPTAKLAASTQSGPAPLAVGFDASQSSAVSPATITTYSIVYGDGGSGTGITQNHTYTTAGQRTAKLTVTDSTGCQSVETPDSQKVITVTAPPQGGETMTLQRGLNSYDAMIDTRIWAAAPDSNAGGFSDYQIAREIDSSSALVRFAIFQSQGGPVPDGASITSATLSFYKYSGAAATIKASRVLKNWAESQATWNVAATGLSWTTAGANTAGSDYLATADGQGTVGESTGCSGQIGPETCWLNINVTSGVQAFATGTANYGWKIAFVSGVNDTANRSVISSENGNWPMLRPKLTITYTTNPPQPAPAFRAAASASYGPSIGFRAASSAATDGSSLGIQRPAGTAGNDVMIASISARPSSATIAAPAGWTLVRRIDNASGQTTSLAVFRRVAGAGEPASYTWDVSGATWAVGGIQSFVNVDAVNAIDVESGQATAGGGFTHATPSVTTTVANAMVVTSHTFATSTTWTPPTGMTEAFDVQFQPVTTNQGQSIEGNYVVQAAAGATGTKTATAAGESGAEDIGAAHILALRPGAPVLSIERPAGTAANDVMVASISARPSSATIAAPTGWLLVRRIDNTAGQTTSLAVFRKVAGAGEPSSYTWDVSGATWAVGGIQSFVNVDTTDPVDVENGEATPAGLTHATPSVITTVANAMMVTSHAFATSTTWTSPSGMTEAFDVQYQPTATNTGQSMEGNYVVQATAGATGTKTATAAGGSGAEDYGTAHILGLRPAAP